MGPLPARLKSALIVFLSAAGLSAAGTFLYFQHSLRATLESGISERLGVPAQVGFARIGLLPWAVQINRVAIENPGGFEAAHFLKARDLRLRIGHYDRDTRLIRSPLMTIDGMDVWIEREGARSNAGIIQDNLARFERQHGITRADKTRFIVRELRIRGLAAHLRVGPASTTADIPDIVLRNVGGSSGITLGELAGLITRAAIRAALRVEATERIGRKLQEGKRKLGRKLDELFD